MENYCVVCGKIIPEGIQVCPACLKDRDLIAVDDEEFTTEERIENIRLFLQLGIALYHDYYPKGKILSMVWDNGDLTIKTKEFCDNTQYTPPTYKE